MIGSQHIVQTARAYVLEMHAKMHMVLKYSILKCEKMAKNVCIKLSLKLIFKETPSISVERVFRTFGGPRFGE